jgi:CDP-diacylglycerol--serine O-phosphatidyltransferase
MSELKRGLNLERKIIEDDQPDATDSRQEYENQAPRTRRLVPKRKRRKRKRSRLTLAVLPTLLTLGNGVCGLAAIAVAVSVNLPWDNETKLLVAGILIFAGMLFDALDGSAARMTGQESQFGAELDSLCDAITFGTAPAVIVWRYSDGQALPQKLCWAIGVLFALCVLIRLARFNVESTDDDPHDSFDGLPSPAAAGTIAAFAIAMPELTLYATDTTYPENVQWIAQLVMAGSQYFIAALTLSLAYLMVSRFQYPHVFQQLLRGRRAPHQIGQALFVVIGAFLLHWLALPIAFCYYAFASPVRTLVQRWRQRRRSHAAAA